jgi:hypothetical protein
VSLWLGCWLGCSCSCSQVKSAVDQRCTS